MENKPMKLLIVEDDLKECKIYRKIVDRREDVEIVAITNSSSKAIEEVKNYLPDAVILDLELNNGEGSGFDFIERIEKMDIKNFPKIVVTTNVHSDSVYDFCHENNIDFIFYKKQQNYSQEKVINTLILLKGYDSKQKIEEPSFDKNTREEVIKNKINKELDNIGISSHLQGRQYLFDAIFFIIENDNKSNTPIVQYLVGIYKKSNSTISRAMQNAILHAWRVTPLEDLCNFYTARIDYERGVPTPTELIYFYAEKIKKEV